MERPHSPSGFLSQAQKNPKLTYGQLARAVAPSVSQLPCFPLHSQYFLHLFQHLTFSTCPCPGLEPPLSFALACFRFSLLPSYAWYHVINALPTFNESSCPSEGDLNGAIVYFRQVYDVFAYTYPQVYPYGLLTFITIHSLSLLFSSRKLNVFRSR